MLIRPDEAVQPDLAVTVGAPLDLKQTVKNLEKKSNYLYNLYFMKEMVKIIKDRAFRYGTPLEYDPDKFKSLYEVDEHFTGPMRGFNGADHYYETARLVGRLDRIKTPTKILAAMNDPFVDGTEYVDQKISPYAEIELTKNGGHLGFLERNGLFKYNRYMDDRLIHWVNSSY